MKTLHEKLKPEFKEKLEQERNLYPALVEKVEENFKNCSLVIELNIDVCMSLFNLLGLDYNENLVLKLYNLFND